jgi:hypothetical protein
VRTSRRNIPPSRAALTAALAIASALAAQPLGAQDVPFPDEIFRTQPPVTEADVPAALELLAAISADSDRAGLTAIGKRHGLDEARTVYVYTKFSAGFLLLEPAPMSEDAVAEQTGSRRFLPSADELAVMKAHSEQIFEALRK